MIGSGATAQSQFTWYSNHIRAGCGSASSASSRATARASARTVNSPAVAVSSRPKSSNARMARVMDAGGSGQACTACPDDDRRMADSIRRPRPYRNPMLRSALLLALALSGVAGESDPLAAALTRMRDPDAVVREAAALALGRAGDARAVPLLAEQIVNHIGMGNRDAAMVLGWLGAASLPALKDLLAHADPFCRTEALRAAQELGPVAAPLAGDIATTLGDTNRYVRRHALIALRRIGPAAAPHAAAISTHLGDWLNGPHAARALVATGDLAAVRAGLGGAAAGGVLTALGDEPAIAAQVLDAILPHLDDAARCSAALDALGGAGPAAAPHVARVAALIATAPESAAAALARIGTPAAAVPALLAVASTGGDRPTWRNAVIDAVAACAADAGRDGLATLARNTAAPAGYRLTAARALARRDAALAATAAAGLAGDKDVRAVRGALALLPAGAPELEAFAARKEVEIALIAATRLGDVDGLAAALTPQPGIAAKERKARDGLLSIIAEAVRVAPPTLAVGTALDASEPALTRAVLGGLVGNAALARAQAAGVTALIAHPDHQLRLAAAAVALRHGLGDATAAAVLRAGLASVRDAERLAALAAIGGLGATGASLQGEVERCLRADDWKERSEAEAALARIRGSTDATGDDQ